MKQTQETEVKIYSEHHSVWSNDIKKDQAQELKEGSKLKGGAEEKIMEGCCLLACSLWLAQPTFL